MTPSLHDDLLQALSELHALFPDWRHGQMISNLVTASGATDPGAIWEIEDQELLEAARRLIERNAARGAIRS